MEKLCFLLLVIVLAVLTQTITARDIPSETNKRVVGLTDQKNLFAFGGLGGFAGFNNGGQPIGGGGIGVGIGVGIGNDNGIGGAGVGGLGAAAGGVGTFGSVDNGFAGLTALGGAGDDGGVVPLP